MTANGTGVEPPTRAELDAALADTEAAWARARSFVDDAHLEYAAAVRGYVEAVRADDRAAREWAIGKVTAARARYHQAVHVMVEAELTHREAAHRYHTERSHAS